MAPVESVLSDLFAVFVEKSDAHSISYEQAYRSVYCASLADAQRVQRQLEAEMLRVAQLSLSAARWNSWTRALADVFLYHDNTFARARGVRISALSERLQPARGRRVATRHRARRGNRRP